MTWYPDLGNLDYLPIDSADKLKAIGWLSADTNFQTGNVSEEFFARLCLLLVNPWHPPFASAGIHLCELCQFTGGRGSADFNGHKVSGRSNNMLFVPGDDCLYVTPESITHYIDAHHYLPPDEFCDAVMNCPPMRSIEYLKKLLANGGRDLFSRPTNVDSTD